MTKPTPKEKYQECGCPNEYPCSGAHPRIKRECWHDYNIVYFCPKCKDMKPLDPFQKKQPSPSPEARVDWEKKGRDG